jgi:lipopolysaccharide transport system ATP-binding protein
MSGSVIKVENLGKRYIIRHQQQGHYVTLRDVLAHKTKSLGKKILSPGARPATPTPQREEFWALKDVSFEINQGDRVGIIGRNGAGKSTLLKVLSRITEPTTGRISIKGRVASLLEVGTGFHPELTGRENIFLNGAILGMGKAEIKRKFDEIVDFAEVEKFLDTPVKYYSSGMYVRLAFAVAAHLEPEILVVDEVLAVGDAQFQKKCLGKMEDVSAKEGRTVLFVSHNMAAVENLCHRAVVLDQGLIRFAGTQTTAISEYQRSFSTNQVSLKDRTDRKGSGEVRVVGIEFRDVEGHIIDSVVCGQDFDIVFHFETSSGFRSNRVIASVSVKTQWGVPVFLHHNRMTGTEFGELPSHGAFVCRIHKCPMTPSTYRIGYSVMINGLDYLDIIEDAAELSVIAGDFFGSSEVPPSSHGFCLVEGHWSLES